MGKIKYARTQIDITTERQKNKEYEHYIMKEKERKKNKQKEHVKEKYPNIKES